MNDLTMTNVWLAILAIVSLLEFVMIAAVGLYSYKAYKQAITALETVERVHVAPLRARVDAMLDEVQIIINKVKHTQDSIGHAVRAAVGAGELIAGTMSAQTRPVLSILRGVRMAAHAIRQNGKDKIQPARGV